MKIYPAIDIRGGRCVRLTQGRFDAEKIYDDDPLRVADAYAKDGARLLHVVDLDGSREGEPKNAEIIARIVERTGIQVQVAGGIRTTQVAKGYLDGGADRIVLGSIAVTDPNRTRKMLDNLGRDKVTLAIDVRVRKGETPQVATHGWQQDSGLSAWEVINRYSNQGPLTILCTDIGRDGMLTGPNLDLYRALLARYPQANIQASGGVQSLDDLRRLRLVGVAAAITGKALLEERFTLVEALAC